MSCILWLLWRDELLNPQRQPLESYYMYPLFYIINCQAKDNFFYVDFFAAHFNFLDKMLRSCSLL